MPITRIDPAGNITGITLRGAKYDLGNVNSVRDQIVREGGDRAYQSPISAPSRSNPPPITLQNGVANTSGVSAGSYGNFGSGVTPNANPTVSPNPSNTVRSNTLGALKGAGASAAAGAAINEVLKPLGGAEGVGNTVGSAVRDAVTRTFGKSPGDAVNDLFRPPKPSPRQPNRNPSGSNALPSSAPQVNPRDPSTAIPGLFPPGNANAPNSNLPDALKPQPSGSDPDDGWAVPTPGAPGSGYTIPIDYPQICSFRLTIRSRHLTPTDMYRTDYYSVFNVFVRNYRGTPISISVQNAPNNFWPGLPARKVILTLRAESGVITTDEIDFGDAPVQSYRAIAPAIQILDENPPLPDLTPPGGNPQSTPPALPPEYAPPLILDPPPIVITAPPPLRIAPPPKLDPFQQEKNDNQNKPAPPPFLLPSPQFTPAGVLAGTQGRAQNAPERATQFGSQAGTQSGTQSGTQADRQGNVNVNNPELPGTRNYTPPVTQNVTDNNGRLDKTKKVEIETKKNPEAEIKKRVPTAPPGLCQDPCIADIQREIKKNESKDCPTTRINVPIFRKCKIDPPNDEDIADFDVIEIEVPAIEASNIQTLHERIFKLQKDKCRKPEPLCIAAVPEWWQVRLGADRPQLIVQYAEKLGKNKFGAPHHIITIPHYNKSADDTAKELFSPYQKGQSMGVLTLADNSKLIVNCISQKTAELLTDQLTNVINSALMQESQLSVGQRKGQPLKTVIVYPRIAKFFSTGQQNMKPDWIKYFKGDDERSPLSVPGCASSTS